MSIRYLHSQNKNEDKTKQNEKKEKKNNIYSYLLQWSSGFKIFVYIPKMFARINLFSSFL